MKTLAFILAIAFAAPLAAQAQTQPTPHERLVQKIQSTYHIDFGPSAK